MIVDCLRGDRGEQLQRYMQVSLPAPGELCHPILFPDKLLDHLGDPQIAARTREITVRGS